MADEVTAGTQAAGFDRAGGLGAAEQTSNNSEQIRALLDQAQQLMIEDGMDPATAEALTGFARPATQTYSGNLADLNRMGQIATSGVVYTPPGEADIQASSLDQAFAQPPPPAPDAGGLQTPVGQIDEEGNPTGQTLGEGDTGATADDGGESGSTDLSAMTKAQLEQEASNRGVTVTSSMTKQEMIDAINAG